MNAAKGSESDIDTTVSLPGLARVLRLAAITVLGALSASGLAGQAPNANAVKAILGASAFIENRGQWDARALYLSEAPGENVWITQEGPIFEYMHYSNGGSLVQGHVVKMSFVNARPTAVSGQYGQGGTYNYLTSSDKRKWAIGVRRFAQATAEHPYDGISVKYSMDQGAPRYDVIVKPGADPSEVGLKIEGADNVRVQANGNIAFHTSLGTVEERGLNAYQDTVSGRRQVPCRMIIDNNVAHFDVGSYDTGKTLIIDPLVASTFLGNSFLSNSVGGMVLDKSGNVYVAGVNNVAGFPTTVGAFQKPSTTFVPVAYVAKLNPGLTGLVYTTFLGNATAGPSIAIDSTGVVTIAGTTESTDFPTTSGAFQTVSKVPQFASTGFVSRINATGTGLVFSTYLGGSGMDNQFPEGDSINGIAIDSLGNTTVGGVTWSTDYPTTSGALQTADPDPTFYNGFVTRLNSSGSALIFSTYLSGSNGSEVNCVATTGANAIVGGDTGSKDFPVTLGAYQTTPSSGFVSELTSTGGLVSSTFLSGATPVCFALDALGNITLAGPIGSGQLPVTKGAYSSVPSGSFIARFDPTLSILTLATYFGSQHATEEIKSIALDSAGEINIAGTGGPTDVPVTPGAFEATTAGLQNGFASRLSADGTTLLYSTLIGGDGYNTFGYPSNRREACNTIAINQQGNVVLSGPTCSFDFPTTTSAYQAAVSTSFVLILHMTSGGSGLAGFTVSPSPIAGGSTARGSVTLSDFSSTDTVVTLGGPALLSLPSSVTIPAGRSTAIFNFTPQGVAATTTAVLTATIGTTTTTIKVNVTPAALSSISAPSGIVGGVSAQGSVQLTGLVATSGDTVHLSSNSSLVTVPGTVVVTTGSNSANFSITTSPVSASTPVTLSATFNGVKQTTVMTLTIPVLASLYIHPDSVVGGTTTDAIVHVTPPAGALGEVISISSNSPDAIVQSGVFLITSQSSNSFPIKTLAVTKVTVVTITVSCAGTSLSEKLTLTP